MHDQLSEFQFDLYTHSFDQKVFKTVRNIFLSVIFYFKTLNNIIISFSNLGDFVLQYKLFEPSGKT